MSEEKYRGGCSPRMDKCKASCRHRLLVDDYRIERHRQEMEEEAETLGWAVEIKRRRENGLAPVTFKEWLIGHRQPSEESWSGSSSNSSPTTHVDWTDAACAEQAPGPDPSTDPIWQW